MWYKQDKLIKTRLKMLLYFCDDIIVSLVSLIHKFSILHSSQVVMPTEIAIKFLR